MKVYSLLKKDFDISYPLKKVLLIHKELDVAILYKDSVARDWWL